MVQKIKTGEKLFDYNKTFRENKNSENNNFRRNKNRVFMSSLYLTLMFEIKFKCLQPPACILN